MAGGPQKMPPDVSTNIADYVGATGSDGAALAGVNQNWRRDTGRSQQWEELVKNAFPVTYEKELVQLKNDESVESIDWKEMFVKLQPKRHERIGGTQVDISKHEKKEGLFATLASAFSGKKKEDSQPYAIVGPPGAGKKSMLVALNLKPDEGSDYTSGLLPYIPHSTEHHRYYYFDHLAGSGAAKTRPLYRKWFPFSGILFLIDSTTVAKEASTLQDDLRWLMEESAEHLTPVIVFANKQDQPTAVSSEGIATLLDMEGLCTSYGGKERLCTIQGCSVKDDFGILDGFHWIHAAHLQMEKGKQKE